MKNVRRFLLPAAVIVVLVLTGCPTAPEPVEDPPPEEVAPEDIPVTEQEEARSLRDTIRRYELDQYAVEEFTEAEEYYEEAEALMEEDPEAATESYIAAIALYEQVVRVGFGELIDALKAEIAEVRAEAEGIRADVAARSEFEQGVEAYDQAEQLEMEASWEPAYHGFQRSLEFFQDSYGIAREKRDRADDAMARAQEVRERTEREVLEMEDELEEELEED